MSWKLNLLTGLAKKIYSAVHPLLGTAEAKKIVGSGFGGDETRLIDNVSERAALQYLRDEGFSCIFIGEEYGVKRVCDSPKFYLIIDGVDGTNNAMRGIKFASASIAMSPTKWLNDLEAAVVIDLYNGGIYAAEKDKGAKYNGKPISTSTLKSIGESIISVNVTRSLDSLRRITPIAERVRGLRALGSASLEICHVASGFLDAYIDLRGKLRTMDFAAGLLIIKEAGGVLLQPNGEEIPNIPLTEINRFSIIASANKNIFDEIISLINIEKPSS